MNFFKKIIMFFIFTGCTVNLVSAKPFSSKIDFPGGTISPTATYSIDLRKLVFGIFYNITCDLNNVNQEEIVLGLNLYNNIYLDNTINTSQPHIKPGHHTLRMNNYSQTNVQGQKIILTNSDQNNSLIVVICSAIAS